MSDPSTLTYDGWNRMHLDSLLKTLPCCNAAVRWADTFGHAWTTALYSCQERDWFIWLHGKLRRLELMPRGPMTLVLCQGLRQRFELLPEVPTDRETAAIERLLRVVELCEESARSELDNEARGLLNSTQIMLAWVFEPYGPLGHLIDAARSTAKMVLALDGYAEEGFLGDASWCLAASRLSAHGSPRPVAEMTAANAWVCSLIRREMGDWFIRAMEQRNRWYVGIGEVP